MSFETRRTQEKGVKSSYVKHKCIGYTYISVLCVYIYTYVLQWCECVYIGTHIDSQEILAPPPIAFS